MSTKSTKWSTLSILLTITVLTEAVALYAIEKYAKIKQQIFFLLCAAIYGGLMPFMLYFMLQYEDIGMVNFLWNIFSTMCGFLIGVMLFSEKCSKLQWVGVGLGCVAFAFIILGNGKKK